MVGMAKKPDDCVIMDANRVRDLKRKEIIKITHKHKKCISDLFRTLSRNQ